MAGSRETKSQLLYRERRQDGSLGEPVVFLKTAFNERAPRFSPDGRFVVYVSDGIRQARNPCPRLPERGKPVADLGKRGSRET
jgi:hypothetical protein